MVEARRDALEPLAPEGIRQKPANGARYAQERFGSAGQAEWYRETAVSSLQNHAWTERFFVPSEKRRKEAISWK
jgi:sarcosine oxidase delta subunit